MDRLGNYKIHLNTNFLNLYAHLSNIVYVSVKVQNTNFVNDSSVTVSYNKTVILNNEPQRTK